MVTKRSAVRPVSVRGRGTPSKALVSHVARRKSSSRRTSSSSATKSRSSSSGHRHASRPQVILSKHARRPTVTYAVKVYAVRGRDPLDLPRASKTESSRDLHHHVMYAIASGHVQSDFLPGGVAREFFKTHRRAYPRTGSSYLRRLTVVYDPVGHVAHAYTSFTTSQGYAGAMKEMHRTRVASEAQFDRMHWKRSHGKFSPLFI